MDVLQVDNDDDDGRWDENWQWNCPSSGQDLSSGSKKAAHFKITDKNKL